MSTTTVREKAITRPIDGLYPDMAKEVRRLLGWDGDREFLSSRVASRKTGVNHATIATMARGDRPAPDTIRKFAHGMGIDANSLMVLADYAAFPSPWIDFTQELPPIDTDVYIVLLDPESTDGVTYTIGWREKTEMQVHGNFDDLEILGWMLIPALPPTLQQRAGEIKRAAARTEATT